MMPLRRSVPVLLLAGSAACYVSTAPMPGGGSPGGGSAPPAMAPDDAVAQFVALANEARRDAGCSGTLEWHADLAAVAQAHSRDMLEHDYFDHEDRFGRTPMQRVQAAGVPVRAVAENIAQGHPTGAAVLRGWLDSPGHRRNLLNCHYSHHGVGLVGGYWTHVLAEVGPVRRR